MKLWLLCLWFYWPLIKLLPVEAHNEADDWCGWENYCLSELCGFIGSAPNPHSIKASPTYSGNWLGKGNELSAKAPQATGEEALSSIQEDSEKGPSAVRALSGTFRGQPGPLPIPAQRSEFISSTCISQT